jgi:glycosyltransferase involved in cell wall biosynthesis
VRILLTVDPEIPVPPKLYGGIERIVAALAAGLVRRGHEVGVVAHPDSEKRAGWQLFSWRGSRSQNRRDTFVNAWQLRKIVAAFEPDIVHSFSRLLYLGAVLPRALPKIMSYQRLPTARTVHWAARAGRGSLTFTGCSEMISHLGRRAGGTWETIPNFVDLEKFIFSPAVPADAPLVFLSRIERIKGAHTAIQACLRAGRRLILAGNRDEGNGADAGYWRNEIAPHLGRDGIEYVGPVDDEQKIALLGQAAAMIVPIEWEEPFGIVFIEALACGTPVISCPRGALPEIVGDGREGFLVGSVDEGVRAIGDLPRISRQKCRARVETTFSSEVIVPRYDDLYRRRISGTTP